MQATTILTAYAKQNEEANATVARILDEKFSLPARQEDRGSYYGGLEGLFKHIAGGTGYFLSMFKASLAGNSRAQKTLANLEKLPKFGDDALDINGWESLKSTIKQLDKMWVDLAENLSANDYDAPVAVAWYGGNPATVPLGFMFANLAAHNLHHRAQISQILDEQKIDNNYSAINIAFWK